MTMIIVEKVFLGLILFVVFLYIVYKIWKRPSLLNSNDETFESTPRYKEFIDEEPDNKE